MKIRGIDAGGSVTRIARTDTDIFQNQSMCMEIPVDAPTKGHIIDNKVLDFVFKKSPCETLVDRRFVKQDAMNQYSGDIIVCNNQEVKVLQEVTYVNILASIAVDCIRRGLNDEEFKVGICIPAAEYYDDINDRIGTMKDNLAGSTAIYFPMLDKTIRFTIARENIGIVAEGVVAAYKFKSDKNFVLKNSVIVDVGYRSSDITILIGFKPVGASAASRPIGGVNLEANIQSKLERDNIFVSTQAVQKALCTTYAIAQNGEDLIDITEYIKQAKADSREGYIDMALDLMLADEIVMTRGQIETAVRSHYLVQGKEIVDITHYVHSAKEMFVDSIYRAVLDVANAKMMAAGDLSNVLCIGRPFSGDPLDPYNMINMLKEKFRGDINMYAVPDAGIANVVEIIKILGFEDTSAV